MGVFVRSDTEGAVLSTNLVKESCEKEKSLGNVLYPNRVLNIGEVI